MQYNKTAAVVSVSVSVLIIISLSSANGVPLPQAEQQRIENLAVSCTEAVSENYYYGNFTTTNDESLLAQCDDLFVDLKNQCDAIGFFMEQCSDPAYDKYILDRGLSSRIEPEEQMSGALGPFSPSPPSNNGNNEGDQ